MLLETDGKDLHLSSVLHIIIKNHPMKILYNPNYEGRAFVLV